MSEKIPSKSIESGEKIHNEREIINIIESIIDSEYTVLRSLEDENGLYMLEVVTTDDSGDSLYTYIRAGTYSEASSKDTAIDVIFYSDGIPVGGRSIAKYRNGEWVKEVE
jgi:hypothetical protein